MQQQTAASIAKRLRIAATIAIAGLFACSKPAEKAESVLPAAVGRGSPVRYG
jgi:hypothetical protein